MFVRGSLAIAMCLLATTLAQAETCGESGSPDILTLEGWRAEQTGFLVSMTIQVRSNAPAPIKMIDGTVWFTDALGGSLGGYEIERDLHVAPGALAEDRLQVTEDRFLKASPTDISGIACVKAVLYEDGTKAEF